MRNLSQAILDSIIDHIAVINNKGIIIAVNESWIQFSYENNGDLCSSYIHTNYLEVCQKEVKEGIELVLKGSSAQFTFEYPCHDNNQLRWFLLRASPISLDDDNDYGAVISHVNITDRKIAELKLAEKEERYRLITENSTDFISIHTISGVFTFASPICESLLGYQQDELIGKPMNHFIHPEDRDKIKLSTIKKNDIQTIAYRIRNKDGEYLWVETKLQRLSSSSQQEEFICISRDITAWQLKLIKLEEESKRLQQTIYLDELTGVYNRRFFNKLIEDEYNEFVTDRFEISLLMIDIDYFKQYNDTYGHLQGDQCLYIVANTIKQHVQEKGLVCRVGGEEFCVILPNITRSEAVTIAEKLCKKVESRKIPHETSIISPYITISIGVSNVLKEKYTKLDIHTIVNQADQALYKAKENGRNNVIEKSFSLL